MTVLSDVELSDLFVGVDDDSWGRFVDEVLLSCSDPDDEQQQQQRQHDEEEVKRQSRLQRNRQSAWQSRQRKKWYVTGLEAKCRLLEGRCTQLEQSVRFVSTENVVLRQEVSRLNKAAKSGVAEPAVLVKGSLPLEFLSRDLSCLVNLVTLLILVWCQISITLVERDQHTPLHHPHHKMKSATTRRRRRSRSRSRRRSRRLIANGCGHLDWIPP
ncbi:bZIP transcription factor 50-like isoform X2 [Selaginella moellendorffii]|uniref:bZIP transcription factor 50-like isoform X2 n=1 Tax=Selaginella moellendorffii TaxID=88036 RepID=UPI000D1C752D|nr:bZIP transcription factor 50-like isoform X2 [Selaginella moellendorffii]|eukprot:XP_024527345.1 bZIP transcription factor 50-like isoform X2 [Selaginella moellendorffii]